MQLLRYPIVKEQHLAWRRLPRLR